jgi:predicted DNA-binding ribbon-helix-helix protein
MPKSSIAKRSIVFNGKKTSVSLEDEFWNALKEIADKRGKHISHLERIPVMFEHSRHGERSSCILAG